VKRRLHKHDDVSKKIEEEDKPARLNTSRRNGDKTGERQRTPKRGVEGTLQCCKGRRKILVRRGNPRLEKNVGARAKRGGGKRKV